MQEAALWAAKWNHQTQKCTKNKTPGKSGKLFIEFCMEEKIYLRFWVCTKLIHGRSIHKRLPWFHGVEVGTWTTSPDIYSTIDHSRQKYSSRFIYSLHTDHLLSIHVCTSISSQTSPPQDLKKNTGSINPTSPQGHPPPVIERCCRNQPTALVKLRSLVAPKAAVFWPRFHLSTGDVRMNTLQANRSVLYSTSESTNTWKVINVFLKKERHDMNHLLKTIRIIRMAMSIIHHHPTLRRDFFTATSSRPKWRITSPRLRLLVGILGGRITNLQLVHVW